MNQPPQKSPLRRREVWAWAMYDWANSAYTTLSITVLIYFVSKVAAGPDSAVAADVQRWSQSIQQPVARENVGDLIWAWGIALSMFVAAMLSPIMGAMADARANKRQWLCATAFSGALGAMLLAWIPASWGWTIVAMFVVVSLFFELSFGFYNGFLPELAEAEEMDSVSALGFALGYIGGGVALAIQFIVYMLGERIGLATLELQFRAGLTLMGLWWGGFTIPALLLLRDRGPPRRKSEGWGKLAKSAFGEVRRTLAHLGRYRTLTLFLIGFLLYNDGISTVISQAPVFATKTPELSFTEKELLPLILVFQFVCFPGAAVVGLVTRRIGQWRTLMFCLCVWIVLLVGAYFVQTKAQFWGLSILLGIVLGGTQSVARAMMALMTPKSKTAEFMGFFNFSGRATSWLGTFIFGLVIARSGSARLAIVSLLVLFILGTLLTIPVNVQRGQDEARE